MSMVASYNWFWKVFIRPDGNLLFFVPFLKVRCLPHLDPDPTDHALFSLTYLSVNSSE